MNANNIVIILLFAMVNSSIPDRKLMSLENMSFTLKKLWSMFVKARCIVQEYTGRRMTNLRTICSSIVSRSFV